MESAKSDSQAGAARQTVRERFTNQKRIDRRRGMAWERKRRADGNGFLCGLRGHRFVVGEGVRWVYAKRETRAPHCNSCHRAVAMRRDGLERRIGCGKGLRTRRTGI